MESELSPYERVALLKKRIESLKIATGLSVESRLREIRKAEVALALAEKDAASEKRRQDKTSRAIKPIPSESDKAAKLWLHGMERETRQK